MAARYTHPKVQWMDSNGDPLTGGKLYFYESGTSTPLDTYSDEALTSANANPVVADSSGTWSDIWLKPQDYKVVLKDQNDVQIWSADPVNNFGTDETGTDNDSTARVSELVIILDGGGSTLTAGFKRAVPFRFACTINEARMVADQSGSVVVDIWKDVAANYPPTDADSITASAPLTISSDTDVTDSTLTGWTTTIAAGDDLMFNVDSATSITWVSIALKITKT